MEKNVQQNLHKYFVPLRQTSSNVLRGLENTFFDPPDKTPKSSRHSSTRRPERKRTSLQLPAHLSLKRPNFEVLECDNLYELPTDAEFEKYREIQFKSFKCCFQQEGLPGELHVEYSLEIVSHPEVQSSAFESISAKTLGELLTKLSKEEFMEKYFLCAHNVHDPNEVGNVFFPSTSSEGHSCSRKVLIFYCEYSQKRGPAMAHCVRAFDRSRNCYPEVDFKEMYLLDRGYSSFYRYNAAAELDLCEPNGYIKMRDKRHAGELRKFRCHQMRSTSAFDTTLRPISKLQCRRNRCRMSRTCSLLSSCHVYSDDSLCGCECAGPPESPTKFNDSS
ncbi:unnamed protein product [Enterobius vermicularis]|uniref:protein-tyrosine-phosphatase n=1 Tax=Enterobius vermicularis TaxID=51028 RepID=A0A0N4VGH8_ENTVE|nr:unnamed protein product [Enterobius vermicularis]